jgi:hypothetical protein
MILLPRPYWQNHRLEDSLCPRVAFPVLAQSFPEEDAGLEAQERSVELRLVPGLAE